MKNLTYCDAFVLFIGLSRVNLSANIDAIEKIRYISERKE